MSDTHKKLKPMIGTIVRDPLTMTPLAADGDTKPWIGPEGRYWRRKVYMGECVIIEDSPIIKSQSVLQDKQEKRRSIMDEEG